MLKKSTIITTITVVSIFLITLQAYASDTCERLKSLKLQNGEITSATLVEAGKFTPPGGGGPLMGGPGGMEIFKSAPAFCRVTATLTPTPDSDIKIEVWLPADNWNGILVGTGNGVWGGSISHSALAEPLQRGYAAAATNAGHVGTGMDAKFAIGNREKLIDFGHRAVHEMTVKAKTILAEYYGQKEKYALWVSCSTGGRQGLMAAYRYPGDYDGISSMAPANPMVDLMTGSLWTGYVAMKDEAGRLSMPDLMLSNRAWINKCDEIDGLKDGIVSDPEACSYDPGVLKCDENNQKGCLTAPQIEALRKIYDGARNPRTGELIFSGFAPGSEQLLMMLVSGKEPFPVATSYFRDIVFEDPEWDFRSFDYDKDLKAAYDAGRDILDVPPDGLSGFFEGGGKLLLSHGWADGLIPAANTIAFYKSMKAALDEERMKESTRLFMIPGMGHCGGGDGPSVVDMLSALDNWVSEGEAPEKIIAGNPPHLKPMTRPVCPWPQIPVYKGSGSTDDASNFECGLR